MIVKNKTTTMSRTLVATFFCIILVMGVIAYCTFSYITKYAADNISREEILEQIAGTTLEQEMEGLFGVVGTRMIFLIGSTIIVGVFILVVVANIIIKPIQNMSEATKKVSKGDFDVELKKYRNDEIGELTDEFNHMVKELKKLEYLRKDFVSNVSHEFKTPMTAIEGYVELLDDENLTPQERKEYIQIIKNETKRLTNLTNNSLRLSRLENQDEQQNLEEYMLDEQIRKCIVLLQNSWEEKNIEFDLNLKEVKIYAEKELIEQIWINIISNAIKFSNDGGKVSISLETENNMARVCIKDNGIGIEEEKLDRIFEKFYQVDKSHLQNGSGLGLAITKRIIHLCNGDIDVKSKVGEGTAFTVYLPLKK